ncbi:MAG TPA: fumarylacetoacetase [Nakamurella sp.]|nr:fumarylacetoacetase [Nakamurella sp.]
MSSWVERAAGCGYDIDHLPYGVFSPGAGRPRVGVRIADSVLDLAPLRPSSNPTWGWIDDATSLNPLLAAGPAAWTQLRDRVTAALSDHRRRADVEPHLYPLSEISLHPCFQVADYVDFYASEHHAAAVGRLFRPDAEPLLPNWKHLPVGYHGRSGTIVPSGNPIVRPCGQRKAPTDPGPTFGPTRRLDVEAELGFVVGAGSTLSHRLSTNDFASHVFGVGLVNDWSARDIQSWEYVPLGPFLGKSFATSISHWITPLAALQAARVPPPPRSTPLLDYLADDPAQPWGLDIAMSIEWNGTTVSRPPFASMYYTGPQLLAQLTANGASVRTGDLFASGTVSGPKPDEAGSFLELSDGGRREIPLAGRVRRTFLEDGDTVTIRASAPAAGGGRLRLGEVTGTVLPALC